MASISSTDSIGNTSLRGYGGMASGIDRDAIIEKMTLGTTTKISNQKGKITQLQWKQEAYRNISDQIIDFGDNYTSFSSTKSLKDPSIFAKSLISVHGKEESTQFVTASGTSELVSNVSIAGVDRLATSTVRRSNTHASAGGVLQTGITNLSDVWKSSNLEGSRLVFGVEGTEGKVQNQTTLTLPSTYTVMENGKEVTKTIDYTTTDYEALKNQLNDFLANSELKLGDKKISDAIEFGLETTTINGETTQKIKIVDKAMGNYKILSGSTALTALGYEKSDKNLVSVNELTHNGKSFEETGINSPKAYEFMEGQKVTFNYDGSQKEIELLTSDDVAKIKAETDPDEQLKIMQESLQKRLDQAFGKDAVKAVVTDDGLGFKIGNDENTTSSVSILSSNSELLSNMGIAYGESNKVNLNGKISQAALLGDKADDAKYVNDDGSLNLTINGTKIEGLTANSSISDILSKINSTSDAGVKATYVDATGQFMLVSTETGAGREINLDSDLAKALFGQTDNGKVDGTYKEGKGVTDGKNAVIYVSYGDGTAVKMERASNSFNLEGLNVNITGTFGKVTENAGVYEYDASQAVTFTAKADVDGAVERVKSFFEDFNKLVTDINTEVTTRPDSSYGPLTDEQKDEMDETSIENWEKKAKQGLLYGDSAMQDLSADVQSIFLKLMQSGAGFEDLKRIGITYSDDYLDGGTIVFDESKFRTAMETEPEFVSNVFTGGGTVSKGLVDIIDETFTPYATRYASKNGGGTGKGSYGRLIEIAGSEKKPTTLLNNQLYNEIEDIQDLIERLQEQLTKEQDRYISQFTTMETLINQMNTQSSYLSQLS